MFPTADCLMFYFTCRFLSPFLALHTEICERNSLFFSPMRSYLQRSLALCAILLTATIAAPPAMAASRETVAMSVGRLLEEGHYTRQKLNEDVSRKFLQTYLEMLDFSHLFFTQKDVDELNAKYASSMAGDVLLGNLKPAYDIYALYTKRVDDLC